MARRVAHLVPRATDELRSAAYLALVEAAQSFDPSRNVDFATFARHRIEGALRDVRRQEIRSACCRTPAMTRDVGIVTRDLESGSWILGAMPAQPVGSHLEELELVQTWIKKLPRLQSQAFRHIYLEGKTQEQAAALLGCSAPTLSRLHKEAIATIQYSRSLD
jgi:RNA polymerase sigma factor (sigma-70 family)